MQFYCSPLASKPIKQRVEAFEKLQTPQKETRTRGRVMTTESEVIFFLIFIKLTNIIIEKGKNVINFFFSF